MLRQADATIRHALRPSLRCEPRSKPNACVCLVLLTYTNTRSSACACSRFNTLYSVLCALNAPRCLFIMRVRCVTGALIYRNKAAGVSLNFAAFLLSVLSYQLCAYQRKTRNASRRTCFAQLHSHNGGLSENGRSVFFLFSYCYICSTATDRAPDNRAFLNRARPHFTTSRVHFGSAAHSCVHELCNINCAQAWRHFRATGTCMSSFANP